MDNGLQRCSAGFLAFIKGQLRPPASALISAYMGSNKAVTNADGCHSRHLQWCYPLPSAALVFVWYPLKTAFVALVRKGITGLTRISTGRRLWHRLDAVGGRQLQRDDCVTWARIRSLSGSLYPGELEVDLIPAGTPRPASDWMIAGYGIFCSRFWRAAYGKYGKKRWRGVAGNNEDAFALDFCHRESLKRATQMGNLYLQDTARNFNPLVVMRLEDLYDCGSGGAFSSQANWTNAIHTLIYVKCIFQGAELYSARAANHTEARLITFITPAILFISPFSPTMALKNKSLSLLPASCK